MQLAYSSKESGIIGRGGNAMSRPDSIRRGRHQAADGGGDDETILFAVSSCTVDLQDDSPKPPRIGSSVDHLFSKKDGAEAALVSVQMSMSEGVIGIDDDESMGSANSTFSLYTPDPVPLVATDKGNGQKFSALWRPNGREKRSKAASCGRPLWWLSVPLVAILLTAAGIYLFASGMLTSVFSWLHDTSPVIGSLVLAPLFLLVSLPVCWGYMVLNIGAGYLWGFAIGQVVVFCTAATGTFTATLLCRYTFRPWVEQYVTTKPMVKAVLAVLDGPECFKIVALTRLSPFPYGLQNGIFALTQMPMTKYMLATVIGCLPTQLLFTYMGTTLKDVAQVISGRKEMNTAAYVMSFGQLAVGVGLAVGLIVAARRQFNKALNDSELARYERSGTELNSCSDGQLE